MTPTEQDIKGFPAGREKWKITTMASRVRLKEIGKDPADVDQQAHNTLSIDGRASEKEGALP